MTRCPFCLTKIERGAVICPSCNARRGFLMFGSSPDGPIIAFIKGLILPAIVLVASLMIWVFKPSPIWLGAAGFSLFAGVLGIRRLIGGSRWFQL